ncbi:MAG: hypothetical protein KGI52_06580, partial [Burkholderiales bacterium]|nr:hypothetical protein [Burkholderiales bacterium]
MIWQWDDALNRAISKHQGKVATPACLQAIKDELLQIMKQDYQLSVTPQEIARIAIRISVERVDLDLPP